MSLDAHFTVIVPDTSMTASQVSDFEESCQRYGIPAQLPLAKNANGRYIVAGGLSFRDAQQLRRQIAAIGVNVEVISETNSPSLGDNDVTGINNPETLVVASSSLGGRQRVELGDLMSDAWESLDESSKDLGLTDDNCDAPIEKSERTVSITAQQILNAVREADQAERKAPIEKPNAQKADQVMPSFITDDVTQLADRKKVSVENVLSRRTPEAPRAVATPRAPINPVIMGQQSLSIKDGLANGKIRRAGNNLIPEQAVSFEISDVIPALAEDELSSENLIDCEMEEVEELLKSDYNDLVTNNQAPMQEERPGRGNTERSSIPGMDAVGKSDSDSKASSGLGMRMPNFGPPDDIVSFEKPAGRNEPPRFFASTMPATRLTDDEKAEVFGIDFKAPRKGLSIGNGSVAPNAQIPDFEPAFSKPRQNERVGFFTSTLPATSLTEDEKAMVFGSAMFGSKKGLKVDDAAINKNLGSTRLDISAKALEDSGLGSKNPKLFSNNAEDSGFGSKNPRLASSNAGDSGFGSKNPKLFSNNAGDSGFGSKNPKLASSNAEDSGFGSKNPRLDNSAFNGAQAITGGMQALSLDEINNAGNVAGAEKVASGSSATAKSEKSIPGLSTSVPRVQNCVEKLAVEPSEKEILSSSEQAKNAEALVSEAQTASSDASAPKDETGMVSVSDNADGSSSFCMSICNKILLGCGAVALVLVILLLIHDFVTPIPFVTSLAKPF